MEWMMDFFEKVDRKTRGQLLRLGLPVAGLRIEVEKEGYYFGRDFFVDRKMNYYYQGARVRPRVWKNIAVVRAVKKNLGRLVAEIFGVERPNYVVYVKHPNYAFYKIFSFSLGRVSIEDAEFVQLGDMGEPFPGIRFNGAGWSFPRGAPKNMYVWIGFNAGLEFREGDISYALVRDRDYKDYYAAVGFKGIEYAYVVDTFNDELKKAKKMVLEGNYAGAYRALRGAFGKMIQRRPGRFEVGNLKVLSGPFFVVFSSLATWEELEKEVRVVDGWSFLKTDSDSVYWKMIGALMLQYRPDEGLLNILPVNGQRFSVKVPIDVLLLDFYEMMKVIEIL